MINPSEESNQNLLPPRTSRTSHLVANLFADLFLEQYRQQLSLKAFIASTLVNHILPPTPSTYYDGHFIWRSFEIQRLFSFITSEMGMIINNKNGIFELPNQKMFGISQRCMNIQPSAQPSFQNENFVITTKKLLSTRY